MAQLKNSQTEKSQPVLSEKEKAELLSEVRNIVREELESFAFRHAFGSQLLYTKPQAAQLLGISLASVDQLILRGLLKLRRFGSRKLIPHGELARIANQDIDEMWPAKRADPETGKRKTPRSPYRKSPNSETPA
jgi:hypothetical protein